MKRRLVPEGTVRYIPSIDIINGFIEDGKARYLGMNHAKDVWLRSHANALNALEYLVKQKLHYEMCGECDKCTGSEKGDWCEIHTSFDKVVALLYLEKPKPKDEQYKECTCSHETDVWTGSKEHWSNCPYYEKFTEET